MDELAAQARQGAIDAGWNDVKEARAYMPNSSNLREDAQTLKKNQDAYLADLAKETAKMTEKADELQASTARFIDASGKIKADELKACSSRLDQARFSRLVLMILGRSDTLDRVRGLSDEHKKALLNHEAEQAESRHRNEVSMLKQQLADARDQDKTGELTTELDTVKARLVNANQRLINKTAELETVNVRLANSTNQSESTIADLNAQLNTANDRLTGAQRRLDDKNVELSRVQDELSSLRAQLNEANAKANTADSLLQGANAAKDLLNEQIKVVAANYETTRADLVVTKGELETTKSDLAKSKEASSQASEELKTAVHNWNACETTIFDLDSENQALKNKSSAHEKELAEKAVELEKVKGELRAQHTGLATFFAGFANSDPSDAWRSLATTMTSADWTAGTPTDERPWTLLPAWYGENLEPLPEPTPSTMELLLRMFGAVVASDFGRGSADLVRHLRNALVDAPALPVALLVDVANKALVMLDDVLFKHSVEKQLFNLAFRQLLKLVQKCWPCPEIEPLLAHTKSLVQDQSFTCIQELEAQIHGDDHASLRQRFADSRDATGDMPDRNTPFFLSGHLGLLRAAEDHVWALDLDARTVRLIHSTRGKMIKDVEYVFRSSEGAGGGSSDLSIPIEHDGEYFWLMDEWARAIESAGGEMSQYSEIL